MCVGGGGGSDIQPPLLDPRMAAKTKGKMAKIGGVKTLGRSPENDRF